MKNLLLIISLCTTSILFSQSFNITFPNTSADTMFSGQPNTISWSSTGSIFKVHIYQSRNGGISYSRISPYSGTLNNGSFLWTPPNSYQANNFKIKIEGYGAANSQYSDTSDANTYLKIGKTFSLLSPLPKNLVIGTNETIQWTNTGFIPFVDLEYSTDWGPWKSIVDSIPNYGTYAWTVPQDSGSAVRLRITENNNPNAVKLVYGYSMTSSPQTLTLVYPNGGEVFTEGDSVNLQWTRSSNLTGVGLDLYYSLDSGLTWVFITDHMVTNNFHWNAPLNVSSSKCLIRIFVNGTQSVSDDSDSTFTINQGPPSVTIVSPNDAGEYLAGRNSSLNYRATGGLDTLSLSYSIDGGVSYSLIKNDVNGSAQWTSFVFPDIQEASVLFKLQSNQMPSIFDVSDSAFSIHKYKIYAPYNNQVFYQGATANISWGKSITSDSVVNLHYSLDNAITWDSIATQLPNSGSYSWTVPNVQTSQLKVRIQGVNLTNHFDISTGTASIIPSPITITSPNGGEYWDGSTSYPITWTTDSGANVSLVRIKYSINGGQTWLTISNSYSNTGSYNWNTPNIVNSAVLVRIENRYSGGAPSDNSDAPFSIGIIPPTTIGLISPNGGETYFRNQQKNILWNSLGNVDTVDVSYSSNNGSSWQVIASNLLDIGSYNWTIPNLTSTNCLVRVLKSSNNAVGDTSAAVFSILPTPVLNLISPNGGETFAENQNMPITWDTTAIDSNLIIQYSNNGGVSYSTISPNASNTGTFLWNIPAGYSTNTAKIRIEGSVAGIIRNDFSSTSFTISPPLGTLTLTSPNGGEMWPFQTSQDITWSSTGIVGNVNLSYSIDTGNTWIVIKNNEPNDGIESWSSGFGLLTNVLVKVEESSQPLVFDISDSAFQIIDKPHSLYMTSPNQSSGQTYTEGDNRTIVWNSTGILNMVNLYVSSDNGVTYTLIADSIVNNLQGSSNYTWLVPHGFNSTTCKIKIEEFGNPAVFNVSRKLTISDIRTLTILSPNGGEIYNGMDTINIRWVETGIINSIQLSYSLDSGLTWNYHHVVQVFDTNTFIPWVAPNQNLTTVLVRASSGVGILDASDGVFSINAIPRSIVLLPVPDTVLFYGNYGIDWTSIGVINFRVMQSLDSGQTWGVAPGNFHGGPNHFNWSGPQYNTTGVMLRIEDQDSSQYFSQSQLLVIKGYSDLEVVTPNGGELFYTDSVVQVKWRHYPGSVTANSLLFASVHYSIDTGLTWNRIVNNQLLTTDSIYNWTVPASLHGTSALIKVQGEGSTYRVNNDISDNLFHIESAPELSLTTPINLDIVYSDSTVLIDWNSNVSVSNVNIQYKLNSTNLWTMIDSNVVDTGSYLWNIPVGLHDYAEIRVSVTDSIQINDSVNLLIKPNLNHLNMIFPNGGEVFDGGQYINPIWDWSGVFQFQWELKLSTDSGLTWHNINDGQHFEGVLDSARGLLSNVSSTKCLIAITSFPYGDTSDAVFTINYNSTTVDITSPNSGGNFLGNTTTKLTWDTISNSHIDSVFIGVANSNGGIIGNLEKVANSGSSPLEIPNLFSTTNARAFIRLDDYIISDFSDTAFSIIATANDTLLVVSPNGREQLVTGQQFPIVWQASNTIPLIDIEFSSDSGVTWSSVVNNTSNCGFYLWTVPTTASMGGKIRISGNTKAFISDESDAVFGVQLATGLSMINSSEQVKVFPNPVQQNGILHIANRSQVKRYKLIDIRGKVVQKGVVDYESCINLKAIPKGSYIIKLVSPLGVVNKRIVIH